jgi:hypothetical protein
MDAKKYVALNREVFIIEKTVLEGIVESKNNTIKQIMRIVDNNLDPSVDKRIHANIRSVVLDEVNDMARAFADILERAYKI